VAGEGLTGNLPGMPLSEAHQVAQSLTREAWNELWRDHAAGTATAPLPAFPAEEIQKLTNNQSGVVAISGATALSDLVDDEVRARLGEPTDQLRLLDYGAGWGRITRLFLRTFHPGNISAVDVDATLVDAGTQTMPGLDFRLIGSGVPLPYDTDTFDVVVANSVFSHLSEELHRSTLVELARVTKPSGLMFLTTLNPSHYDAWLRQEGTRTWITKILGDEASVRAGLTEGGFVYGPTGRWPDYGIALLPDTWAEEHWPGIGLDWLGKRTDYQQDVQIARPGRAVPLT
jgi:2-polyprenyl-3-methyl-5-hydroxy-6-metoxy-1,4-benzoquinol methylase